MNIHMLLKVTSLIHEQFERASLISRIVHHKYRSVIMHLKYQHFYDLYDKKRKDVRV